MVRPALIAAVLLSLTIRSAWPSISFVNGSFETPGGSTTTITAPNGFAGWTVASGNIGLEQAVGGLHAQIGKKFLFLPGGTVADAEVDQSLSGLFANIEYEIGYYLCTYNNDAAAQSCSLEVVLYNHKVDTLDPTVPAFTSSIGTAANPWTHRSFQFTAEGTTGVLSIENTRSAANGAYIALDGFTIRVVPKGQPTVAFLGGKPRKPIRKSTYLLRGTSSTVLPLASITVATKHKTVTLSGSANWTAKIRLKSGANRVTVTATDIAGTISAPIVRTVRHS